MTKIFSTKFADWEAFESDINPRLEIIRQKIQSTNNAKDLDRIIDKFDYELRKSCDKNIPKIKINPKIKANKWWTKECQEMKIKLNSSRRRYQRNRNSSTRDQLLHVY